MPNHSQPDVVTVLVTRVDGGVTVMRVVTTERGPDGIHWTVDATTAYIDSIIAKHNWQGPLAPVSWRLVPNSFVDESTDRYFRNAWKDDGSPKPGVDMPKAREIHRGHIRHARAPLIDVLDIAYQRADEANDQAEKRRVAAEKQRLRDLPADPNIEAALTPDALKAVWKLSVGGWLNG